MVKFLWLLVGLLIAALLLIALRSLAAEEIWFAQHSL